MSQLEVEATIDSQLQTTKTSSWSNESVNVEFREIVAFNYSETTSESSHPSEVKPKYADSPSAIIDFSNCARDLRKESVCAGAREMQQSADETQTKITVQRKIRETETIDISENAVVVLGKRYLKKDENGEPSEAPEDMFRRVAENVASAEKIFDSEADPEAVASDFYRAMADLEFLPNSPTLMNAGRELQQLSACFVLPIEDSMESIFEVLKYTALIHKSGGGTGFSFSRLRPQGDIVKSTKGVSSGPVSFMKVFNSATEAVKQGGTRRGANMGVLRVDHPDILEFITAKEKHSELENFNISVAITENFMRALKADGDYSLVSPRTNRKTGQLNARRVFDLVVDMAWRTGDPGIIFIDRMNRDNPTPDLGEIESTNPCGEQPLLPYEACNLGSINLAKMSCQGNGSGVDYDRLRGTVRTAVRFLDDVIEVNDYPVDRIGEMARANRKIGLGVMGWADLLIKLQVPYDSDEAVKLGQEVMSVISQESKLVSAELAEERGPFPNFEQSVYQKTNRAPMRNATTTTIAPTGTLSIIANCSSGIEPLFALCFTRNVLDGEKLVEVNPLFEEWAKSEDCYSDDLIEEVIKRGSVRGLDGVPDSLQKLFVTAHDVSPEWHIKMQAAFQGHTDNAVSKTVNFAHDTDREHVAKAYELAFELGCKGVTIFRDGSKSQQVITTGQAASRSFDDDKATVETGEEMTTSGDDEAKSAPASPVPGNGGKVKQEKTPAPKASTSSGIEEQKSKESVFTNIIPRPRPEVTSGRTEKIATGCGKLYVTINQDELGLCEVFTQMGKAGGCAASQSEAVSRLISLALRAGISTEAVTKHLRGIRCPSPAWQSGSTVLSCPDAIGITLERYLKWQETGETISEIDNSNDGLVYFMGACPECGGTIERESGCLICRLCGFTRCS